MLSQAVQCFTSQQTWEALHRLLCLPKLVLRAPRTKPKKGKTGPLETEIRRRLALFHDGNLPILWDEARIASAGQGPAANTRRKKRGVPEDAALSRDLDRAIRAARAS